MCGILVFSSEALADDDELQLLRSDIAARGPNHWGALETSEIHFEASVLALRDPVTAQPVAAKDSTGVIASVLCFNGEIYDLPAGEQDTQFVDRLCRQGGIQAILSLEGEFAFTYYDRARKTISFGRDRLGRRSLLYRLSDSGELVVASVAGSAGNFVECEGHYVYYTYSLVSRTVERHVADPHTIVGLQVSRDVSNHLPHAAVVANVLYLLKCAVAKRLVRLPSMEQDSIAVLFSGGLDCTIIAGLLDDLLPPGITIDLLNVAFENKRTGALWDTPDRLLARRSLNELETRSKHSTPAKRFRLVEINVPYADAVARTETVKRLMYPNATVMDLSIALAFYFASSPQHSTSGAPDSPIMFSGLGADELFAGYSRHLSTARHVDKLAEELELDFNRLPHRNLGRDDRVCASWGREVRYPFLDSSVVSYVVQLPLNLKTDAQTTKIILRDVARDLGFGNVCDEKKRAIQFGARSAKMDPGSGKLKGQMAL